MKPILAGAVALLIWGGAAFAQNDDDRIRSVIQSQFDAFRADDFTTAFTFASPLIQQMFGTPENFGLMVRNGYPMVYRPGRVTYTDQIRRDGRIFQNVLITDQTGALHLLEYEMVQTPDGWEINGVRLLRPEATGA